ncbi:MAG: hypothetical protein LBO69_08330 [Ignavibacteria bacterium]|jgi:hypothetical protein|nr:hypothetical protein [Ignavibacteria bacterium]
MTDSNLEKILNMQTDFVKYKHNLAFIIGNGIHRYADGKKSSGDESLSWTGLLKLLCIKSKINDKDKEILLSMVSTLSLPEFYDLLCLKEKSQYDEQNEIKPASLQKIIVQLLDKNMNWESGRLARKISEMDVPILTTNFDEYLALYLSDEIWVDDSPASRKKWRETNFHKYEDDRIPFTDFYPLSSYYTENGKELASPRDGFAIWHMHGTAAYPRSMRMGLSHYMGNVAKVRDLIHKGDDCLYKRNKKGGWIGDKTWLEIFFHSIPCFIGIGLEENEIFLRWLMVERRKYLDRYKPQAGDSFYIKKGWYLTAKEELEGKDASFIAKYEAKKYFLESVGVNVIEFDTYEDVYSNVFYKGFEAEYKKAELKKQGLSLETLGNYLRGNREIKTPTYTIDEDGLINVEGGVDILDLGLEKISLKFGKVTGDFDCRRNILTSLEGCPTEVGGDFICSGNQLTSLNGGPTKVSGKFDCSGNQLTSLKGCPTEVGEDFDCSGNQLTSLKGCPTEVGEDFYCGGNKLTSLEGCPTEVKGTFDCMRNKLTSLEGCPTKVGGFGCSGNQLTSLKGCPTKVDGTFDCGENKLTSLEGCPTEGVDYFICRNNQLTSLKGCPTEVEANFYCYGNKLTSLEGCPTKVGYDFNCSDNLTKFTKADVKKVCEVGRKIDV